MNDDNMTVTGTLEKFSHQKVSGDLLVTIRIPKEMANAAHERLGGYPRPEESRHVVIAVLNLSAVGGS